MIGTRAAIFYIPLLMFIIFARQLYLERTENLDPWLGGAMRMYATVDGFHNRVAGIHVTLEEDEYFINLSSYPWLLGRLNYVRILPSKKRLERFSSYLKTLSLCHKENTSLELILPGINCDARLVPLQNFSLAIYAMEVVAPSDPSLRLKELNRLKVNGS